MPGRTGSTQPEPRRAPGGRIGSQVSSTVSRGSRTLNADGHRPARIVLADDQQLIRLGIRSVLTREEDLEIVGEASDGREALELCRRLSPDLLLTDVEMPGTDGLEATRRIKAELPSTSVLVLSAHDDPEYMLGAVQAGADGYILKENAVPLIADAVRAVLGGEPSFDPGLSVRLLRSLPGRGLPDGGRGNLSPDQARRREEMVDALTEREREILGLVARGLSNGQIARELFLSVGTVKTHVHHVVKKLGVSDRTQAAVLAIRLGLAPSDR